MLLASAAYAPKRTPPPKTIYPTNPFNPLPKSVPNHPFNPFPAFPESVDSNPFNPFPESVDSNLFLPSLTIFLSKISRASPTILVFPLHTMYTYPRPNDNTQPTDIQTMTDTSPQTQSRPGFSLLWPASYTRAASHTPLDSNSARDLELARTIGGLTPRDEHRAAIERVLYDLCTDPAVIRYRQDILDDLLRHPDLVAHLDQLLPALDSLAHHRVRVVKDPTVLHEVAWRASELETIVDSVQSLNTVFTRLGDGLNSAGLRQLRDTVAAIASDPTFQHLVQALPDLLGQLRLSASVTIGVNLDHNLRPVEATLLAVNDRKFTASSLLSKLLGRSSASWEGVAPLHSAARAVPGEALPALVAPGQEINPLMVPLFRDLAMVLEKVCRPVADALQRYAGISGDFLVNLRRELSFYLGGVHLVERLRSAGLPMCRPELAPADARVCEAEEAFNLNLALHFSRDGQTLAFVEQKPDLASRIVGNDVQLGPAGRIVILTGPNQGGKTTYIQTIGLLHVLAQAGLYVPARRARISPVDGIYTHYPLGEQSERGTGRFGDEARRLGEIFARATTHSLVLLNESLSSTSAGESLYLAQDLVRILRLMGTRAVFATHLHELAANAEALNASTPGDSRVVSMVSSPIQEEETGEGMHAVQRSYRVMAGPPMGRSYATEIATRFGVSYEQLVATLRARGIVTG